MAWKLLLYVHKEARAEAIEPKRRSREKKLEAHWNRNMKATIKNVFAIAALLFAGSSLAATITPDKNPNDTDCVREEPGQTCWQIWNDNSMPSPEEFADLVGLDDDSVTILYKDNAGGSEEGSLTGSYSTDYTPADEKEDEASGAIITYTGGTSISCPECYLWVKDGNHNPSVYVFDISWWNGIETLILDGFWTGGGAISNLGIFGRPGGDMQVPEPGTLGLLGIAALGLGLVRRRRV